MSESDDSAIIKAAEALVEQRRDDYGDTLPYYLLEPMEQEYYLAQARIVAAIVRRTSPAPRVEGGEKLLPNFTEIYSELEKARENLNLRYLNNNDQSAGRSSRAIFSAMCLLDTARALLSSPRVEDVRREALEEAARFFESEPHRERFGSSVADELREIANKDAAA